MYCLQESLACQQAVRNTMKGDGPAKQKELEATLGTGNGAAERESRSSNKKKQQLPTNETAAAAAE